MAKIPDIKPGEVILSSIGSIDDVDEDGIRTGQHEFAMECDRAMEEDGLTKSEYCSYSYSLPERLIRVMQSIECALLMTGATPKIDYTRLDLIKLAIEAEKVWRYPEAADADSKVMLYR